VARFGAGLLDTPVPATRLLLAANVAVFLAVAAYAGTFMIPGRVALRFGALYRAALLNQDYWRLVATGFLHFSPMHLLFNMMCLGAWGAVVERRVGTAWFVLVYGASLLGGSLVSVLTEPGNPITAGASGAIAGLLGALLYLSLRRMVDYPLQNVAVTVALNVAFTYGVPGISWRAHLGGFAAGILACLVLEGAAWLAGRTLRCRFPEWLTLDLVLMLPAAAVLLGPYGPVRAGLLAVDALLLVKLIDLALCLRLGLAAVAGALGAAQAALLAWAGARYGLPGLGVAALLGIGSLWAHLGLLRRGLRGGAFVPTALQAERRRVRGL